MNLGQVNYTMSLAYPYSKEEWMTPHPSRPVSIRRNTQSVYYSSYGYSFGDIIWVSKKDAASMTNIYGVFPPYWELIDVHKTTCRKPK